MSIRRWILLAAWLGTAAPSLAIDFAFQDPQYSFQSLRALGYAVSGGADIGEVLHTVRRITEGDDESWFREWNRTAEQREAAAREFLKDGQDLSARQEFFRASAYYRSAEFFLHGNTNDPRIVSVSRKSHECFKEAISRLDIPGQPVEIPFEDTTLPGYFFPANESSSPGPLLIAHSGFDGTAEELYFSVAFFAHQRGYNVLLFEGPGQGRVIREQHIPFRPNWESVVTPVVDYALTRPETDPDRIALMGISFGGYLAPRAAAFEKRLAACIANGGVFDFHAVAHLSPEQEEALDSPEASAAMNEAMEAQMKTNASLRWSVDNGLFTFHAATPCDWLRMTRPYTLKDVAGQITCPMLVCDSQDDTQMTGQARKLYDALEGPKDFLLFTRDEGAEEHCQMGAMNISSARILGWLDRALATAN